MQWCSMQSFIPFFYCQVLLPEWPPQHFLLPESNKDQHATAPCKESFHFASRAIHAPTWLSFLDVFWRYVWKKFLVSWHRPKNQQCGANFSSFFLPEATKEHHATTFNPTQKDRSSIFCQCSDGQVLHPEQPLVINCSLFFHFWKATKANMPMLHENSLSFFPPGAMPHLMLHRLIALSYFANVVIFCFQSIDHSFFCIQKATKMQHHADFFLRAAPHCHIHYHTGWSLALMGDFFCFRTSFCFASSILAD